jgi:ligand-binding sensor domain-containing protein
MMPFRNTSKKLLAVMFGITVRIAISSAQYHHTRNITINEGLPSNSIHSIFKDSRGYFWFGSEAGLCRFDGTAVKVYSQKDGLPGNRIWSVTEDSDNNLWLACYGNGISKFDGKKFTNYSTKDGLVNDNVRKIQYSSSSGGLLIGTEFGFSFLKDSVFTSFQDTSITDRDLIQVTDFLDCGSVIYIFTYYDSKRFIQFFPDRKEFRYLPENHRYHLNSPYSTCSFITSKKDTIISEYLNGVKIFTKDSVIINDRLGQVFDIAEDKDGVLWVASWNGGSIPANKSKGGIYRMKDYRSEYYNDLLGINSQECYCVYYDEKENLFFIGTLDNGVYIFDVTGIGYTPAIDLSPSNPHIHDILYDSRENTWISAGERVFRKNQDSTVKIFTTDAYSRKLKKTLLSKYSYLNDRDGSFQKYKKLREIGLYKYENPYLNGKEARSARSLYVPESYDRLRKVKISDFYSLHEDYSGNIWVITNAGIINLLNDSVLVNLFYPNESNSFFIDRNNSFLYLDQYEMTRYKMPGLDYAEDFRLRRTGSYSSYNHYINDRDIYWLYNNTDGLMKYSSGTITEYPELRRKTDLSFSALIKDRLGNLIAGTISGQIYIMKAESDSINLLYTISQDDGIIGTDIRWMIQDRSDRLWFATNKGLNMIPLSGLYNEEKRNISFFDSENGFFDLLTKKAVIDRTGNLLIISDNNLFTIDPDRLAASSDSDKKLLIEDMELNFNKIKWSDKYRTDQWSDIPQDGLVLSYKNNTLAFFFHLIQYSDPLKARYSYKLAGLQDEWTQFSEDDRAVFTSLSAGKYRLQVRGMVLSAPGKIVETEFSFSVLPPWWRSWWFYVILLLNVVILTALYLRYKFRKIRKESEINRKIAELKMDALKSQMNPHFIFNAFNSIQKYILKQDTRAALDYMSEFAMLIRQTLDNSTKVNISLSDEIKYLTSYLNLEKKRVPNLNFSIELDSDIEPDELSLPPMLLQPFIENSILHGIRHKKTDGLITVKFHIDGIDSSIVCTIADDGIGRAQSKEINESHNRGHRSHGTYNTLERMKVLGIRVRTTDLKDESGNPSGTLVELKIKS